jgi:pentatricopeptide repeat protein
MTIKPNEFIYTIVFSICANRANRRSMELGRKLFEKVPDKYRTDAFVITAALHMFATFGDLDKAEELFASIKVKDVTSYGAMIKAYYSNNNPLQALNLFWQMERHGIELNAVIYICVVKACSEIGMIDYSRSIAARIPKHFLNDAILQNALLDMWVSGVCVRCLDLIESFLTGQSEFS